MFEIISYGGGNLIYQILQGVAMFFGSSDYLFTMKIVATMASVAILIQSAFTGRIPDLKWLLIIIFVYMFVFVPKVTVTVTDTVERSTGFAFSAPTPTVRVVGNVPIGLAFVASFTSHMKDYFVRGAETVFSLPGEMSYRTAGPLFAQGIAEKSLSTAPQNPSTVASLSNFWRDCVFYDIALGFYSLDELSRADDLEDFLRTNVNNNRFYQHISTNGAQNFVGCRASMQTGGAMRVAIDAEKKEQSQWVSWYNNLATKPAASSNNAMMASGAAAMPVAMSYLTGMSITSSRMLGQTILSNSFANGLTSFASQSEAQEVMQSYAAAKAEAERSVTFSTLGKISGRMLPLMNIIAEALIYAVFPIIALFMLWPGGHKAAGAYVMALIWIALWAPMYAVVHFISAFYSSISVGSAAQICDATNTCAAHLNMYTMRSMKEAFANAAAISGFMATMVPYIAYMVVSKSGAMMAGTVGRLMDGYSQPVSHAAAEASAGNVSMGGMNYENQTAFQHNSAPLQSAGHMNTNDGAGISGENRFGSTYQQNQSSLAVTPQLTQVAQHSAAQAVESATSKVASTTASLAEARAAEFRDTFGHGVAGNHALSSGSGTSRSDTESSSKAFETVKSSADKWAKEHKLTEQETKEMNMALQEKIGWKPGGAAQSAVTAVTGVSGSIEAAATQKTGYGASNQASEGRAKEFLASESGREAMQTALSFAKTENSGDTRTATVSDSHDKSATHAQTVRAEEAQQRALQELESAKNTQQHIESQGMQLSTNESNALVSVLDSKMGRDDWQKGLDDVSRGNLDTAEAKGVSSAVSEYYNSRKEAEIGSVNTDAKAAELREKSEDERSGLASEGGVKVDSTHSGNIPKVGQQGLYGAAVGSHNIVEEAHNGAHTGMHNRTGGEADTQANFVNNQVHTEADKSMSAPAKVDVGPMASDVVNGVGNAIEGGVDKVKDLFKSDK